MEQRLSAIVTVIAEWAQAQENVRGLALVGSHARNAARPDSDIDLLVLTQHPSGFREFAWLPTIDWSRAEMRLENSAISEISGFNRTKVKGILPESGVTNARKVLNTSPLSAVRILPIGNPAGSTSRLNRARSAGSMLSHV